MWAQGIRFAVGGVEPKVAEGAFVAPNATLVGDVTVEAGASVWFGAVLRADDAPIRIAAGANIQDNVVIHVGPGRGTVVGPDASVGHAAILHSCEIRRGAVIGMGACVQERVVVGEDALVAAGALVPEGIDVPAGHTVGGLPARVFGLNSERSRYFVEHSAATYHELSARYRETGYRADGGAAR